MKKKSFHLQPDLQKWKEIWKIVELIFNFCLDNRVYSWGNGENGRLGAKYDGKGPNSMCTAYPRPVFGSLHDVPNLAARHWHTIIIAGK